MSVDEGQEWGWGSRCDILILFSYPNEDLGAHLIQCPRFILLLKNFFLAVLGLRCCTQAFSSCGEQGLLFVVVHGLLVAVASLVVEHAL